MRPGRVRVALLATAIALIAGVIAFDAGPSFGVDRIDSGFWWQAEPDSANVPQPPTVPPNGLWVSSVATGPQAISALRFSLVSGETAPVVKLKISSKNGTDPPLVQACPTNGAWKPPGATPGPWSARPVYDCATHVAGALNGDSTMMSFDFGSMASSGQIDVALVPVALPSQVPAGSVPPAPVPVPTTLPPLPVPVPTTLPPPLPPPPAPSPTTESYPNFDITFHLVTNADVAVDSQPVAIPSFDDVPPAEFSVPATSDLSAFVAPPVVDVAPAPAPSAAAAAPPKVAFRPVRRQATPVAKESGRSLAERIVLAAVLAFLIGMSNQEAGAGTASAGTASAGTAGTAAGTAARTPVKKPKLSIYDPPPPRSYAAAPVRVGKPPAIR
ncbi:MAG: hypothetical protein QOG64_2787 [Acidimicrobiaceae bacterium]|nr:hypothetical protein [Acidimicrobiaceae bacterium]